MCCDICSYYGLEKTLKTKAKARLFYGVWHHPSRWPCGGATFGLRRESSPARCAFWPLRRSFIFVGNLEWRYYCIVLLLYCGCRVNTQMEKKRTDVQTSLRPRIWKMSMATVTTMTRFVLFWGIWLCPGKRLTVQKTNIGGSDRTWVFFTWFFSDKEGIYPVSPSLTQRNPCVPVVHWRPVQLLRSAWA